MRPRKHPLEVRNIDKDFWQRAKLSVPKPKTSISIRLDNDVLEWFKRKGQGYQTLINAVLRSYVDALEEGADE